LVFALRDKKFPRFSQFKHLPKILNAKERWVVSGALILILIIAAGGAARFIYRHLESRPMSGGVYKEALIGTPYLINPILATSDADRDISRLIYSGLLRYNDKGELEGDLAEQFELSADNTTLRFTLRSPIYFHDGEPLNSEDVAFTIAAIQNPAWRAPLWRSLQDIAIETPDPRTVIVTFKKPAPSLVYLFTFGILPKHIWGEVDPTIAERAVWNLKPIGSGPFKFKGLTKSRDGTIATYRLARNTGLYRKAPYLEEITLRFFSDFDSALRALKERTVDGVSFVPPRLYSKIPTKGFTAQTITMPHYTGIFFQDRKNTVLKEKEVRKALALALDRQKIVSEVPNAVATGVPFIGDQLDSGQIIFPPTYDPNESARLLQQAGWTQKDGGWYKNKQELVLTLTTYDEPTYLKVAEFIRDTWQKLGVKVKLEAASKDNFQREVLRPRAYEVLLFSIVAGALPDPYPFWHSSQMDDPGLNLSSVRAREIDALLEVGHSAIRRDIRESNYAEFQKQLLEEVPAIILYNSPYIYVTSAKIRGAARELLFIPSDRFNDIEKWYRRSRPGWK